ncbi:alkyl hydroperoxide reductase AhpD [Streptomyces inusitatus]|uniref:Alkyl hydroperoxide reductase AhpD n=1 Tax=Streptomyces inusitatus TaxID=68221 RepID=A0A918QHW4_9ACTN|nr:carboxymuconolactone decarboxylase [Streptomyces inusitatus]GGZ48898.1 alkyl hydroperoxide reductase AhpD [Streptomyces inusitatus]
MKRVLRTVVKNSLGSIRHIEAVRPDGATGLVARVYEQTVRDFGGLAPPIALHSPAPEPLAASWLMLRESLLVPGTAGRAAKEAVAHAVSEANSCPYCVEVHGAALRDLEPAAAPGAAPAPGSAAHAAARWARAGLRPGTDADDGPPADTRTELTAVAVAFHYLNRMVNVFLEDSPLPAGLPAAAHDGLLRMVARTLRPSAPGGPAAGASLPLLPKAPPPPDLAWASGVPDLADAFARSAAAVDRAAGPALPAAVRERVLAELDAWDGRPPPVGRGWLDERTAGLPPGDRPAARLALLTALASYRVEDRDIAAFRARTPGDAALIGLTSWAALAAARTHGARTVRNPPPAPAPKESSP